MSLDVVGIGVPCVDLLFNIDHLPDKDESLPIQEYSYQGGGKVATALVTLARLGDKTGFLGKIGDDKFGKFVAKDFKEHGVDTTHLKYEGEGKTPFSVVLSDQKTSGRNILYNKGELGPQSFSEIELDYIKRADFLHIAYPRKLELEILKKIENEDITTVFDADFFEPAVVDLLPYINVLITSEEFAEGYIESLNTDLDKFEDILLKLAQEGPEIVVITLGRNGSLVYYENETFHQQAFSVETKDTTGAGDVYHGAFIHGLLHNKSVKETAKIASAVSAMKTTVIGGRAGIPTVDDLKHFLKYEEIRISDEKQRIKRYENNFHTEE
ncbi:MAG: hypothetical protein K9K76_05940 [Halanaerobiales bacterium]|nr:hypothetical protein [Halanaerobiales bacterium]